MLYKFPIGLPFQEFGTWDLGLGTGKLKDLSPSDWAPPLRRYQRVELVICELEFVIGNVELVARI